MNSRKFFYVMIGILVLLVGLLLASVVIGNRYLKSQSDKLVAAKLDRKSLNEQQTALLKAKKDLEKYSELRSIARAIVPQDKDQAKTVREIVKFASESGVQVKSITFDDSSLGKAATSARPAGDGNNGTGTSTRRDEVPITQAQPVTGINGVYQVPITIMSTDNVNTFSNFLSFLSKLENNRRTAQVEEVNISSGTTQGGSPYINFTLTVNIFVKPWIKT